MRKEYIQSAKTELERLQKQGDTAANRNAPTQRADRGNNFRDTPLPTDKKTFVSAKIDLANGGLIVETAEPGKYDSRSLGPGVYHMFDLNFFYYDLRANGKVRIAAFRK